MDRHTLTISQGLRNEVPSDVCAPFSFSSGLGLINATYLFLFRMDLTPVRIISAQCKIQTMAMTLRKDVPERYEIQHLNKHRHGGKYKLACV
jgi:hypothetical protein